MLHLFAYTDVLPLLSKVKTSYGSGGPSMPGEPEGIPGTASPKTRGFSFNRRRIKSAGTCPSITYPWMIAV